MEIQFQSNGRLSKPATVLASLAVLGAGFLLLTFGLALLIGAAAIGTTLGVVTMVRRSLRRGSAAQPTRLPEEGRIVLDPALEVQPRESALPKSSGPEKTPEP